MQLNFEINETVGQGKCPNVVHFWDNQTQLFYIKNGQIYSKTTRNEWGEWTGREFVGERLLFEDKNVEDLRILGVFENILIGSYRSEGMQKMLVYEF